MPWILDIFLIILGLAAGVGSFVSGRDSLYKLFLGLTIGFLSYLVLSYQIELWNMISPSQLNEYQLFISTHATAVLSTMLLSIPVLWIIFMLNSRISIESYKWSPSHIMLWLLLPIFLIGILANLSSGSILSGNSFWKLVFIFFENSILFQTFQKLPWVIFLLLGFLVFYKSLFLITFAFGQWLYRDVILEIFRGWKAERIKKSQHDAEIYDE